MRKVCFINITLIILLAITLLLFLCDSLIDIYGKPNEGEIVFDRVKIQDYIRGFAISLGMLFVTIIIIEKYLRQNQERLQEQENQKHLNKAIELLLLSFNKYQKSLYILLYDESRKDELNYPVNFPFTYLKDVFEPNFNMSNGLLTKTRIEEYIASYDDFKKEIHTIYLNNNLKADSKLFSALNILIHELDENENFRVLIDYSKNEELKTSTLKIISKSQSIPELSPSHSINPYVFLYRSINSVLKFKEELKKIIK